VAFGQALYERFRQPIYEFTKFAIVGIAGVLITNAAVAFNYYLLGLGHDKLAAFVALSLGIAVATGFRFWSYRQFVWGAKRHT